MAIRVTPLAAAAARSSRNFRAAHPELIHEISSLRAYRDREFRRLGSLPGRDQHSLTRKLIRLPAIHKLYAFEGIRKAGELANATSERIATVAAMCNPLQPCDEPFTACNVGQGSRRRRINIFGPAKRGRQMMVADLLRHLHPPREEQFLFRGGMPAAFRAVEAAYADGFNFGTETDIVGFYPSVRHEGLAELLRPLPNSVVNHVVWDWATGHDTVVDNTVPTDMRWAYSPLGDQNGIALGSACSPRVGERILAKLIASMPDCRTVAYADNMLVVGRSPDAVSACVQAMRDRAATLGGWASRLRMRTDGTKPLAGGFSFLHHDARIEAGRFTWWPDHRKLNEFLAADEDGDELAGHLSLDAIATAERKISHWRRAYPDWPEGDLWETSQLAALAARRFYMAATPLNRARAATALIASYFANGREMSFAELAPGGTSVRADNRRQLLISDAENRVIQMAHRNGFGLDVIGTRYD